MWTFCCITLARSLSFGRAAERWALDDGLAGMALGVIWYEAVSCGWLSVAKVSKLKFEMKMRRVEELSVLDRG